MVLRRKTKPEPPVSPPEKPAVTVDEHRGGPHGLENFEAILPVPTQHS